MLVWSLDQRSTLMVLISAGSTNAKDDASNNVLALRPFIEFVYCVILKIVMGRSFNEAVVFWLSTVPKRVFKSTKSEGVSYLDLNALLVLGEIHCQFISFLRGLFVFCIFMLM